jgi:hypothetical protein
MLASFAAYKLTIDRKNVDNYHYNHLTEKERLDIEIIRHAVNKVIYDYANTSLTPEAIKKLSKVDWLN